MNTSECPRGSRLPWAESCRTVILKLIRGKWSLGLEFGVRCLETLARCPFRPVQALAGARRGVNAVVDVSGEEIEHQGRFYKPSVTHGNSRRTRSQLDKTVGVFVQNRRARARAQALFCPSWAAWARIGPALLKLFLFLLH
jgi:hypothetical protein